MKILVIQLARLGDIYLALPTLRALKRQFPNAQLHFLCRHKFRAALSHATDVDCVWTLETASILKHFLKEEADDAKAMNELDSWLNALTQQDYNLVVNLSFSPASSYITDTFSTTSARICGYTRTSDGYLSIPDDASAYFYAQVGPGRHNHLHLAHLFAAVAQVDLQESDWQIAGTIPKAKDPYLVLHVGASTQDKQYPPESWAHFLNSLAEKVRIPAILIGSAEESHLAARIEQLTHAPVVNKVGKTRMQDLFPLIGQASLLVGCDSAPIHIASLVQTPCLNLSFSSVNYWETGPLAPASRILYVSQPDDLLPTRVADEVERMLTGREVADGTVSCKGPMDSYSAHDISFEWSLIKAIYMGEPFPKEAGSLVRNACEKLAMANQLAIEQIAFLRENPNNATSPALLHRADEAIQYIGGMVPHVAPLVQWFKTEQLRIGPGSFDQILIRTEELHRNFANILSFYTQGDLFEETHLDAK